MQSKNTERSSSQKSSLLFVGVFLLLVIKDNRNINDDVFYPSRSLCHVSLRVALLNEVKEVRAAGLRALRYLIRESSVLQKVLQLQVDYLISR